MPRESAGPDAGRSPAGVRSAAHTTPTPSIRALRPGAWLRGVRAPAGRQVVAGAALLAIVVAGAVFRFEAAERPVRRPSADQVQYVRLAAALRETGTYGDSTQAQPLHWAPGAPVLFAAADALAAAPQPTGIDEAAARRAQAVVATLTIVSAFALAALLAGRFAGLATAAAIAVYPPASDATRALVSETLGAFTATTALALLVWAWRGRGALRFVPAGLAVGLACLVRADLLPAAATVPLAVAAFGVRRFGWRRALARGAVLLIAAAAAVAPWTVHASRLAGHFVPVTDGDSGTLFVGTYLPGQGTIFGMKRQLYREAVRHDPLLRRRRPYQVPSRAVLDAVAARRPRLAREAALGAAARENLRTYALGRTGAYSQMLAAKLWRMWTQPYHAASARVHPWVKTLHRVLVALAVAGILAGLVLGRTAALALVIVSLAITTAVNTFFVAEPRHAFRMLPALVAAGAAGWALAVRRTERASSASTRG